MQQKNKILEAAPTEPDKDKETLTITQKEEIFSNMSDGILTVNEQGMITYANKAASEILELDADSLTEHSLEETILSNKKNKDFNRAFLACLKKNQPFTKHTLSYQTGESTKHLKIKVTMLNDGNTASTVESRGFLSKKKKEEPLYHGMMILIEDMTDSVNLRQHERDCALLFAGIVMCITLYLSAWSLLEFTLHLSLRTSAYTMMIEGMTLILFLEILFFTSLSLKDVGLIPRRNKILANTKQTLFIGVIACGVLLLAKVVALAAGLPVKQRFLGGSIDGATSYLFTALLQEFLARGVIQTSVKNLMRVKQQIPVSIFLTSLLFTLMHLPFGFPFMTGAFLLSIALGILYEKQSTIWGCFLLHWGVGYLAMCLFF